MSNFINILEEVLREGEQAEEYKAEKEYQSRKEKEAQERRNRRRYEDPKGRGVGGKRNYRDAYWGDSKARKKFDDTMDKDFSREIKAGEKTLNYRKSHSNMSQTDKDIAADAANRHIRRHPKQYKESAFINNPDLI